MKKFLITTTPSLDGYKILNYIGVVNFNIVLGTNLFSDFIASFSDVFGGHSGTYQRRMDSMYEEAKLGLQKKTKLLGGNAVLGFKVEFDEIAGKGKSMIMISATGTACLVESLNKKDDDCLTTKRVSSDTYTVELKKEKVLNDIRNGYTQYSEDTWNFLSEHASPEIISLLIKNTYVNYCSFSGELKSKEESLVKQLDYGDACKIVYPIYSEPLIYNQKDVSTYFSNFIRECNLFNPELVYELIHKDLYKGINILDCGKPFYDFDDLKYMRAICEDLDNLPDVGKIAMGKMGTFSKEKELYYCRHGHKNDSDRIFCTECGENIKGFMDNEVQLIENFKKKTEILAKLINQ